MNDGAPSLEARVAVLEATVTQGFARLAAVEAITADLRLSTSRLSEQLDESRRDRIRLAADLAGNTVTTNAIDKKVDAILYAASGRAQLIEWIWRAAAAVVAGAAGWFGRGHS